MLAVRRIFGLACSASLRFSPKPVSLNSNLGWRLRRIESGCNETYVAAADTTVALRPMPCPTIAESVVDERASIIRRSLTPLLLFLLLRFGPRGRKHVETHGDEDGERQSRAEDVRTCGRCVV